MKILITGAGGFIGRNLIAELKSRGYNDIYEIEREDSEEKLKQYAGKADFVFHLAGVNRPLREEEFLTGNVEFTRALLSCLQETGRKIPVLFSSSIHAKKNTPYGLSKRKAEDLLIGYNKETGAEVFIYRLPNVFGKWAKPNYNSVVATFCHNIARGFEITINDPEAELTLCYIDDVVSEFIGVLKGKAGEGVFFNISKTYNIKLKDLAKKIYAFRNSRDNLVMPSLKDELDRALYATYLSYLPEDKFSYCLKKAEDNRGWLAEFIKSDFFGQIFISRTKPGITRGNHWHHTKAEKFMVIQGEAVIKLRKIDEDKVIEYRVTGENPEVVDIPPGYTHSITNVGDTDVITVFWASEVFNPDKPDTFYLEV